MTHKKIWKKVEKKRRKKKKLQKVNLVQRFIAMQTLIYFMAILFSQFCWIFYGIMIKGLSHVFIAVVSLWINWAKFHFYYIFIFIVLNINTKGFYHWTALIFVQCRSGGRASWSGQSLCMDSHPDNLSANIHLCLSMCDWWTWDARPKVSTLTLPEFDTKPGNTCHALCLENVLKMTSDLSKVRPLNA